MPRPGNQRFAHSGSFALEKFIQRENLVLFRKRLAEPCGAAERRVLLKLLAEEARLRWRRSILA
jgi:hypothetical protein